jgi:UDP-glucose 4-epimerase
MKKILITGGAGFIGLSLTKRLLKSYEIHIIDNFDRGKKDGEFKRIIKNKNIKVIKFDLSKKININHQYYCIFHLAAIVGVDNVISKPYDVLNKNILFLQNILEFSKKQKKLKKFFFFSTSEVYSGSIKSKLIKFPTSEEQIITLPKLIDKRSTYLLSKIYGESLCLHSQVPCLIVRPHNIYGPRMGFSHVIPQLAYKVLNEKKRVLVFNPLHKRTFCFIDDFIEALMLLMVKNKLKHNIYNIGNQHNEINMHDLAKKIVRYYGLKNKICVKKINNSSPKRRVPSILRLKKDINFLNSFSLDQGLKKTLAWYKNHYQKG